MTPTDKTEVLMQTAVASALAHYAKWQLAQTIDGGDELVEQCKARYETAKAALSAAIRDALAEAMSDAHAKGMDGALEDLRDELTALQHAERALEQISGMRGDEYPRNLPASIASKARVAIAVIREEREAKPITEFEDARVQTVYELLCDTDDEPPPEQHWEGWMARRIVDKLSAAAPAQPAAEPAWITLTVEAVSRHFGTAYASDARGRRCLLNTGTAGIDFDSLKPGMRLVALLNERNYVVSATVGGE